MTSRPAGDCCIFTSSRATWLGQLGPETGFYIELLFAMLKNIGLSVSLVLRSVPEWHLMVSNFVALSGSAVLVQAYRPFTNTFDGS